jgi:hypothetical protein
MIVCQHQLGQNFTAAHFQNPELICRFACRRSAGTSVNRRLGVVNPQTALEYW